MIGFITWQTAFGFWVVGFIMGFASSIGLAAYLVHRERLKHSDSPSIPPEQTRH